MSSAYPILLWWSWECVLYLIIIIKPEVWITNHCLGLGHEIMVCAVCLTMFLCFSLFLLSLSPLLPKCVQFPCISVSWINVTLNTITVHSCIWIQWIFQHNTQLYIIFRLFNVICSIWTLYDNLLKWSSKFYPVYQGLQYRDIWWQWGNAAR